MNRLQAPLFFLALIGGAIFLVSAWSEKNSPETQELKSFRLNAPLKPLIVSRESGEKTDLTLSVPQPFLITFWSSDCPECLTGLKDQARFRGDHPDFLIRWINFQQTPQKAKEYLTKNELTIPTDYDFDGAAWRAYQATMPASYWLANNKVVYAFPGRIADKHLQALYQEFKTAR